MGDFAHLTPRALAAGETQDSSSPFSPFVNMTTGRLFCLMKEFAFFSPMDIMAVASPSAFAQLLSNTVTEVKVFSAG